MQPTALFAPRRLAALVTSAALVGLTAGSVVAQRAGGNAVPARADARTVEHVLNRLGFGPRPGDIERVQKIGLAAYIDQQLNPDRIPDPDLDARLSEFQTLSLSTQELAEKYFVPGQQAQRAIQLQRQKTEAQAKKAAAQSGADPAMDPPKAGDGNPPAPAQAAQLPPELVKARQNQQLVLTELTDARILRAAMSERQLDEVLVDFWFNHFNVFAGKGQVREYLPSYERDVIRPHVLGRFRDLLGAVAHSPAMLFYLDNWQSSTPNPGLILPPQVQARLNDPRTPYYQRQQILMRLDQMRAQQEQRKNQPHGLNENYGRELMELHTLGVDGGYTQQDVIAVARTLTGWTIDRPQQGGAFVFRPQMHDTGEKVVLGQVFPAGHGQDEGERVLDILARHPSTSHHIAFQLAQRLIADDPPASAVDRAAATFLDTDGDLRAVVRSLITSPEFFSAEAYRAKVKTPFEFVVSAARATNAWIQNPQVVAGLLRNQLGMPLYGCQPPTGYSQTADAWVNTGSLLSRMNFAVQLVSGQARGIRVDASAIAPDTSAATRDQLVETMLAGQASDATRQVLARAETSPHLVALALGSPEFQRR
jgi:uncharacterized protein (DUF1800 family)